MSAGAAQFVCFQMSQMSHPPAHAGRARWSPAARGPPSKASGLRSGRRVGGKPRGRHRRPLCLDSPPPDDDNLYTTTHRGPRLNGDSAYTLIKALLPGMVARRRGFVLLVSRFGGGRVGRGGLARRPRSLPALLPA